MSSDITLAGRWIPVHLLPQTAPEALEWTALICEGIADEYGTNARREKGVRSLVWTEAAADMRTVAYHARQRALALREAGL